MLRIFKRKIRVVNNSITVTLPKYLYESEGLIIGKEYDFIIRIPDPKKE